MTTARVPAPAAARKKRGLKSIEVKGDSKKRKQCNVVGASGGEGTHEEEINGRPREGEEDCEQKTKAKINAKTLLTVEEKATLKNLVACGHLNSLPLKALKDFLRRLELPVSGKKELLGERLADVLLAARIITTKRITILPAFKCIQLLRYLELTTASLDCVYDYILSV